MGGIGSGRRWLFDVNDTTDDYRAIDVRRWKRHGLLGPSQSFGWQWSLHGEVVASIRVRTEPGQLILSYRHRRGGSDWQDENYPVYLDWTACHLGGKRPWFLCPIQGCRRRVAILYGGAIFGCRQCYRLAYPSQREASHDRAVRRAERIREKLDWEPGILNGLGLKPKGMHWITFHRMTAQHDALVRDSLAGVADKLGLLGESLEDLDELGWRILRRSGGGGQN